MGAGLGFVRDGQLRMARNKGLLKKESVDKEMVNYDSKTVTTRKYPKATEEQLATIREAQMLADSKARKKSVVIAISCGLFFCTILIILLTF